jgi:hypothetical protein
MAFANATGARPTTHLGRGYLLRIPIGVRRSFDVMVVPALAVAAFLARRGSLPVDGLWFDDSWVAAGAIHGRPSALMSVGSGTPGFTGLLMVVHRLGGGGLRDLGVPSLVAGIAGPMLLYIALRVFGYERSIAGIVSATLVVARIPILYSGRVKGYTFDTVWVILVAIALPRLAARRWRWPLAVAWFVCAVVIGTFSAYTMVAMAGAGLILVLHPASDRKVRLCAVGAQAIAQGLFLAVSTKKSDLAAIEKVLQFRFDANIDFSWNPITFVQRSVTHLRRVVEVFSGGSGAWLTILALGAVAGLVIASTKGRQPERVVGRYFLLILTLAFVGALLHRFPFGPTNDRPLSAGGRHTLWLVPAVAFGLAAIGHRLRGLTIRFDALRLGFDAVAVIAAVAIVLVGYKPAPGAPFQGSQSATRFVDASIRPGDVVIVCSPSVFQFADSTTKPVTLVPTPHHQVGFAPIIRDPRIHLIGVWAAAPGTPSEMRSWVQNASRVFVQASGPLFGPDPKVVQDLLERMGFTMSVRQFGWTTVQVWRR